MNNIISIHCVSVETGSWFLGNRIGSNAGISGYGEGP